MPANFTKVEGQSRKDGLSIPDDPGQCVHVEAVHNGESFSYMRCLNDVDLEDRRHGWLCEHHTDQLDMAFPMRREPSYLKDPAREAVENIILTDQRSMAQHGVEVKKIGRTTFKTLLGVRMYSDPTPYARGVREVDLG